MALNYRIRRERMRAVPDMNIGATNTDLLNTNADFSLARRRLGNIVETYVSWLFHCGLFHCRFSIDCV